MYGVAGGGTPPGYGAAEAAVAIIPAVLLVALVPPALFSLGLFILATLLEASAVVGWVSYVLLQGIILSVGIEAEWGEGPVLQAVEHRQRTVERPEYILPPTADTVSDFPPVGGVPASPLVPTG